MFLLDRMLIGGLGFVMDQIANAADQAANDEDTVRQNLLAAQMRFELGEIDAEEFAEIEAGALASLRRSSAERRQVIETSTLGDVEVSFGGDDDDDER